MILRRRSVKLVLAGAVGAISAVLLVHYFGAGPRYRGRSLSAWADDLRSGEATVRHRALEVFAESPDAVRFLGGRIGVEPGPVQRAAERIGRYIPDPLKRPLRRLYDPGQQMLNKHLAAQALQQLGTNAQPAIPALGRMLRDSNVLLAGSAGVTLGRIGPAAVPVLVQALDDPDYNVRASACNALAQLHTNGAPAISRLATIMRQESGPIVTTAAYTLSQIRAPAVPTLTEVLVCTNANARRWAAFALGQTGFDAVEAIPALTLAAKDPDLQVRGAAVDALGRVSNTSKPAAEVLLGSLNDQDAMVRGLAMSRLVNRPGIIRQNIERIEQLLRDDSPVVRSNAAIALGRSGSFATNALPALQALEKDDDAVVRASAREAAEMISAALGTTPRR